MVEEATNEHEQWKRKKENFGITGTGATCPTMGYGRTRREYFSHETFCQRLLEKISTTEKVIAREFAPLFKKVISAIMNVDFDANLTAKVVHRTY